MLSDGNDVPYCFKVTAYLSLLIDYLTLHVSDSTIFVTLLLSCTNHSAPEINSGKEAINIAQRAVHQSRSRVFLKNKPMSLT